MEGIAWLSSIKSPTNQGRCCVKSQTKTRVGKPRGKAGGLLGWLPGPNTDLGTLVSKGRRIRHSDRERRRGRFYFFHTFIPCGPPTAWTVSIRTEDTEAGALSQTHFFWRHLTDRLRAAKPLGCFFTDRGISSVPTEALRKLNNVLSDV